jgi:hypothetical protein
MKTMGLDRIDKLLERRKFTVVPRRIARPVPAPPKRKAAAQKETLASLVDSDNDELAPPGITPSAIVGCWLTRCSCEKTRAAEKEDCATGEGEGGAQWRRRGGY